MSFHCHRSKLSTGPESRFKVNYQAQTDDQLWFHDIVRALSWGKERVQRKPAWSAKKELFSQLFGWAPAQTTFRHFLPHQVRPKDLKAGWRSPQWRLIGSSLALANSDKRVASVAVFSKSLSFGQPLKLYTRNSWSWRKTLGVGSGYLINRRWPTWASCSFQSRETLADSFSQRTFPEEHNSSLGAGGRMGGEITMELSVLATYLITMPKGPRWKILNRWVF